MTLSWDEAGSGDPILFVHGLTEDRSSWDGIVPLLADRYHCIRVDLPGHGASPDADDYSPAAMAAALATTVDGMRLDGSPLVVGHSLGAAVSTIYALQRPVAGVVNVDQPLRVADFARALEPLAPMLRSDQFPQALAIVFEALGLDAVPQPQRDHLQSMHDTARQQVVLGVWAQMLDTPPDELESTFDPLLRAVTVPYLAVHGGDPGDDYVMWLRNVMPQSVIEVWAGDGHYPHLVEPERFAATLERFANDATSEE